MNMATWYVDKTGRLRSAGSAGLTIPSGSTLLFTLVKYTFSTIPLYLSYYGPIIGSSMPDSTAYHVICIHADRIVVMSGDYIAKQYGNSEIPTLLIYYMA